MTPKFLPISCCVIAKPVLTLAVAIRTPKQQMQHFFIRVGAVARLLLSQFPLRPITNATLEGKRKSKNHRFLVETAEAPPVANEARWFRGSVPIFTPQRGWKSADTTVCAFAHFSSCWEKWAVGDTFLMQKSLLKESYPPEAKKKNC